MQRAFSPPANLRGVFAGAGSDGLNEPFICDEIVRLARAPLAGAAVALPSERSLTVAYLGTATYDLPAPRRRQTARLAALGCRVVDCPVAVAATAMAAADLERVTAAEADIVIVSGGNTLYAMDRRRHTGGY